ncbi:MAG: hypothetical protein MESAZ_01518 [Saezia sanguinis]
MRQQDTKQVGSICTDFMATTKSTHTFIQGITSSGRKFRPSDWAERLAGVMSQFRPGVCKMQRSTFLTYSPWCVPTLVGDIKCVAVNHELQKANPQAWSFVMSFASDNDLQVSEACLVPDDEQTP